MQDELSRVTLFRLFGVDLGATDYDVVQAINAADTAEQAILDGEAAHETYISRLEDETRKRIERDLRETPPP